jgi:hypothetical protein
MILARVHRWGWDLDESNHKQKDESAVHPFTIDDGAFQLVPVANLINCTGLAVQGRRRAVLRLERGRECAIRVRRGRAGRDARAREPVVSRQVLEERNDRLEERDSFRTRGRARREALGLERREARAVLIRIASVGNSQNGVAHKAHFSPLMLP